MRSMTKINQSAALYIFKFLVAGAMAGITFLAMVNSALAAGIPTSQPLFYGGYLEDAATGKPASGTVSISVSLYKTSSSSTAECTTNAGNVLLSSGRFRVALNSQCLTAIQNNPDLWVGVLVNGSALPRSKIGAVPYAIETKEADPVFKASAASSITSAKVSNWDKAVTSESDPVFTAHAANKVTTTKMSNWDSAFGWGSHASAGYLKGNHYTNAQAVTAMGAKGTSNPLNHDRYASSECLAAVAATGYVKGSHTTDAKTLDGFYTNSTTLAVANTIPVTDSSGKLRSALIPALGIWSQSGSNVYYDSGNVGVGTKTPSSELDVVGTFSAKSYANEGEDSYGSWQSVVVSDKDTCDGNITSAYTCGASSSIPSCLDIQTSSQKRTVTCVASKSGVIVSNQGKVGIGLSNPTEKLEVAGKIKATSFLGSGSGLTGLSQTAASVPVGAIIPWAKNLSGVPSLSSNYVECNGQILSDKGSPLDGTTIPNLNGTTDGTKLFLRGAKQSGGSGNSYSHSHGYANGGDGATTGGHNTTANHIPPYYEVVMIIRVK